MDVSNQLTKQWIIYGFKSIIEIPNVLLQFLVKIPGALQYFGDFILKLIQNIPWVLRAFGSFIVTSFGQMMEFLWFLIQNIPGVLRAFGSFIVTSFGQMMEFLWFLIQNIPQLLSSLWMHITYFPLYLAESINTVINIFLWLSRLFWNGSYQIWLIISEGIVYLWGMFFTSLLYYFGCLTSELARMFTTLLPQFARYIFHHLSYVFIKAVEEPKASFSIVVGFLVALFAILRLGKL